ncbi:MAG: MarR family transcriptional regulator, partial [Ilumatobacteraceae bacterium]
MTRAADPPSDDPTGSDPTGRDPAVPVDPIELARRNWVDAGWSDAADGMMFVTSLVRAQQLVLARIEDLLRPHGLTFARFEVLRLLA